MTPQEKAIELVEFFKPLVYSHVGSQFLTGTHDERLILKNSKKCANRCVDEILEFNKKSYQLGRSGVESYWQEVKNEIQKL